MIDISIIIPSYNQKDYLPEAIESALENDSQDIIVVDDGSTDGSLDIAKRYEPRIKVISQVNKGLASARNTGIMNATGDYILFLDADDILLEKCIFELKKKYIETHADIIAPSFKMFGTTSGDVVLMANPTLEDFKESNRIGYCAAVKREALLEIGGYNPKMTWGAEDYDLWHDLLKRGKKLVTIPTVLWLYRIKPESMWAETAKHEKEFREQIRINHPEVYNDESRQDIRSAI